jgi:4'-phosphopantetheinyl transferase
LSLITDMEPDEVTQLRLLDPQALLDRSEPLVLHKERIHVWSFALEGSPALIQRCRGSLSPAERQRADRFVFPRDQLRHTIAHGVLRHLLGRCVGAPPESLQFATNAAGKPTLAGAPLHFNLSHSDERALLGVSATHEIGVDVEKVRSNIEALAISRHYFFGSEREAIERAPQQQRDSVFFRYWVAKEAVLKAQGVGLGFPLDRFHVAFNADGARARIETLDPDRLEGTWRVRMLPTEAGWPAAIAARGDDWELVTDLANL